MFRFVDRHAGRHLVVVPGWAFDDRVFAGLDLPYDYHIFSGSAISALVDEIERLVSELGTDRLSLLGWSQGAFAVCEFAGRNPKRIDELLLVGARRKYDGAELDHMRAGLSRNKSACLKGFYRRCFAREEMERYQWFKSTLLKDYLKTMSTEQLIDDLDWLGRVEINPDDLRQTERIWFIHGAADAIAPAEQAEALAGALPQAQLTLFEQTGHLPFLRDDFARCVHGH